MHVTTALVSIVPGQAEAWRRWTQELAGSRRLELTRSCERLGITRLMAWTLEVARGDVVVLHIESRDPHHGIPLLAASRDPFDLWIKQRVRELHGIDLEQAPREFQPELVLDWPNGLQPSPRLDA